MENRRIVDRRPGKRGEQRRLFDVHILEILAEIKLGCSREAVLAVPHEVLVAVEGEDLILRVIALDLNRQHGFLDLAAEAALGRQEKILAQLLRQRAAAFNEAAGHEILQPGPCDAVNIDAPVRSEILVFDGNDGVFDDLRNLVVRLDDSPFQRKRSNDPAVVGFHFRDEARMVVFE